MRATPTSTVGALDWSVGAEGAVADTNLNWGYTRVWLGSNLYGVLSWRAAELWMMDG